MVLELDQDKKDIDSTVIGIGVWRGTRKVAGDIRDTAQCPAAAHQPLRLAPCPQFSEARWHPP
jgi:hypothetical protein